MGTRSCCRREESKGENNLEQNLNALSIQNNELVKMINMDQLINTISQEKTITQDNNNDLTKNKNSDNLLNVLQIMIKKIQNKFRTYHNIRTFQNKMKSKLAKDSENFVENIKSDCKKEWRINALDDFSLDNWKQFYPSEDEFFNFDKGKVLSNQVKIENLNNPGLLEIYEGEMNFNFQKHGTGKLTTPFYKMEGTWRDGEFTGWGRKEIKKGDVYEGKFIKGHLNGKGQVTTNKYNYVGEFKNDELNGYGEIQFLESGDNYKGKFENNDICGVGVYEWKNGDKYEGAMKNGKMNGYGKYTFANGKIFIGEYVNGIKHGKGKLIEPNNKIYEGIFENGQLNGECLFTKNGHTSKVMFSNGKFVKFLA